MDSIDSLQNFGFEAKYYFRVNSYHISATKESIPYQSSYIMLKFQQNRTKPEVIRFYLAFDKTRNMEHPGTSNNYDNYEKKSVKLNFGLSRVTIWSAQTGHVTLCSFP